MERGVIWEFLIVVESERGMPLKVKKRELGFRVWGGIRVCLRERRVRLGFRVRARIGIWRSGDWTKICNSCWDL